MWFVPTYPHPVAGLPLCRWQDSNLLDAFTLSGYREYRRGHVQRPYPVNGVIGAAWLLLSTPANASALNPRCQHGVSIQRRPSLVLHTGH